jgi:hypothetical protein
MDLGEYLVRLVDIGYVEPFDVDSSILILQEKPALLGKDLVVGTRVYVAIRVVLVAARIEINVVEVVDDVKLGNWARMVALSLEFIACCRVLLPGLVPFLGN